ncbi:hypothetical protein E2C01_052879 [Portunus trituberculatus]|uniref:Uncharacterized protein n=1 Tax=Portunus trituberculatus TaxID=210409 RepID=A0A5B7GMN5_PORTR|nr:hypothetical protein [Portunus trituberculatus]
MRWNKRVFWSGTERKQPRLRAQCMDVNAKSYRWSELRSKVCQMCDMGEDEMVEHVVLECMKYAREN